MARVNVESTSEPTLIEKLAKRCKGEFFSSWNGTLQFGFTTRANANLFCRLVEREMHLKTEIIG